MDYRTLGRTGLRVSALGFGCGNVGGLMVRGTPAERERAVARALALGINYFDTAPSYGDGLSEQHLGQALRALGADAIVGTKVRLGPIAPADIPEAIARSADESLRRLGLDRVDLLQLHDPIAVERRPGRPSPADVVQIAVPAFRKLVEQGKTRFVGITALGDTAALHRVIDAEGLDTAQVCFNLLNPSAAQPLPAGFPAQDFDHLLDRCRARATGAIVIRVLAGGALSGVEDRHPTAQPEVAPIATSAEYAADVAHARHFEALVREGHAGSLVEASLRFALTSDAVSTVLLGYSSQEHLEYAASCIARGPLPVPALARLPALWQRLAAA